MDDDEDDDREADVDPDGTESGERGAESGKRAKRAKRNKLTREELDRKRGKRRRDSVRAAEGEARLAALKAVRLRTEEARRREAEAVAKYAASPTPENDHESAEARRALSRAELELLIAERHVEEPRTGLDVVTFRQLEAVARLRTTDRAMAFSLGIDKSSISRWMERVPGLREHLRALNSGTKDALVRAEVAAALRGDVSARRFILRSLDEDFRRRSGGRGGVDEEDDGAEVAPDWRYI